MLSVFFDKISKFPVFSLTVNLLGHFPCFPCAVGTLTSAMVCSKAPVMHKKNSNMFNILLPILEYLSYLLSDFQTVYNIVMGI